MRRLLVATHNAHKTAEIREMLGDEWEVSDLTRVRDAAPPEEVGDTFEANAVIKAASASARCPGLVLADDSGLEVDAMSGEPGVRSARYAGEGATDAENRAKLLHELERRGAFGQEVSARFRCAMALAEHGRVLGVFTGAVEGAIRQTERGSGGFGYDSLFVPQGYDATFAELAAVTKNHLSHRARALAEVRAWLTANRP